MDGKLGGIGGGRRVDGWTANWEESEEGGGWTGGRTIALFLHVRLQRFHLRELGLLRWQAPGEWFYAA